MGRIQRSFEKQDCGFSHQLGLPRLASWKVIWFTRPVLRHLGLMRSHDSCMWFCLLGFKAQTGVPQQWPNTQTQRSVICWDSAFLKLVPWPKTLKKKKKVMIHTTCMLNHVWLFATPQTSPPRLLCLWDSPDKNTWVGCHFLLQGTFLTQASNLPLLCLLHYRQILYHWATRKIHTRIAVFQ